MVAHEYNSFAISQRLQFIQNIISNGVEVLDKGLQVTVYIHRHIILRYSW